jgi:hypothetical protein
MLETSARNGRSRRMLWLGILVVMLFGAYSAGWFWLAAKIRAEAPARIADLSRRGVEVQCANPSVGGYPFRIGLYCESVAVAQPRRAFTMTAGAFRSAGQIFDPMWVSAELESPAKFSMTGTDPVLVNWDSLSAGVRLSQPLPKAVSFEGTDLRAGPDGGKEMVSAKLFGGEMRPNGADLDVTAQFASLAADPSVFEGRRVPALSGKAELSLKEGVALLVDRDRSLRGKTGMVTGLVLTLGEKGGVTLSGPFSIDQDGLVDAQFKVTVQDPMELSRSLSKVFPDEADKIRQGMAGLAFLGSKPTLPLRITKGSAVLSFIPLGRIPPVPAG